MLTVNDLMTHDVVCLGPSDTLLDARKLMHDRRFRHVPVVRDGAFLGLVTHRDLLRMEISGLAGIDVKTQEELDAGIPLSEVMQKGVITIARDASVRDVARIMLDHKIGCLPVTDGEKLVGIVTEADFLKLTISLIDELSGEASSEESGN